MAVGHVRYGTTGGNGRENCQPIVVNHIKGRMALAHNGNLVNSMELRQELELQGSIFHTTSDTEVISYVITKERLTAPSIESAVNRAMYRIKGAYSLVIMSPSKLIAVRDEHGFRPLCYGRTADGGCVVASESCALDALQARFIRDLEPGEIMVFDKNGARSIRDHCGKAEKRTCIFEYIYFARPDSVIDGVSVHEARVRAGECLARRHPVDADVVIGVPDSGLDAAVGYSRAVRHTQRDGLYQKQIHRPHLHIPRPEITGGHGAAEAEPHRRSVRGKRVVMIDDSIVRGTTCAAIVNLLRSAGASEVHVRVSAPPFLNPCYYGTDIDSRDNLIASKYSIDEIARQIGADSLGYLPVSDLGCLVNPDCAGRASAGPASTGNIPPRPPRPPARAALNTG
jgi:amidophosphoribosyltransferase